MDELSDIEDFYQDPLDPNNRHSSKQVAPKSFQRSSTSATLVDSQSTKLVPGTAKIFLKTWGCSHNNSDSEYMAGLLAEQGHQIIFETSMANTADVWVLNSCTVKGPSQQTFQNEISAGVAAGKKVVVAGCVPQASPHENAFTNCSVVGVQQIDKICYAVEQTLAGNTVRFLKETKRFNDKGKKVKSGGAALSLPKIRRNPYIEIIAVNTGCLNQCTYCKTKHARGDLGSYSVAEIVDRVATVLGEGVLEIWLTSEDIGAYGRDININIVLLLKSILPVLESEPQAMLRIGMTNPPYILEHLQDIAVILNHKQVYAFLHVPVQAGSTQVLEHMQRLYTIEDFYTVCDTLCEQVKGITIATDIICGYPTETEDDFEESLKVLAKYQFPVVHISQFYPRPGTPAARLQRLDTRIVKDRSRRATALFHSYGGDEKMTGAKLSILVTEVGADGQHFVGHDKYYRQVLVPNNPSLMGKRIDVVVTEVSKWSMVGIPVESYLNDGAVMPKLARAGKEIVVVGNDANDEKVDARRDGAVFSSGKSRDNEGPASQSSILNWKFCLVAAAGLLPLIMTPVRPSLKVAVLAMGTVGVLCAKDYKFK